MADDLNTNFIEVTKDVFYAFVGPLNVHPRIERDWTYWETPNRHVVGLSNGDDLCTPARYMLLKSEAA